MRNDPEGAAEGSDHAGLRPARKAGCERIEHAGSGRGDDDQRGDQEVEAHGAAFPKKWFASLASLIRSRKQRGRATLAASSTSELGMADEASESSAHWIYNQTVKMFAAGATPEFE